MREDIRVDRRLRALTRCAPQAVSRGQAMVEFGFIATLATCANPADCTASRPFGQQITITVNYDATQESRIAEEFPWADLPDQPVGPRNHLRRR
jgi:hypothetical protein